MKAVAEATINELKSRLRDRDGRVEDLLARLEELKRRCMEQHLMDRQEIERLNQKLFERNDSSIQDLKVARTHTHTHTGVAHAHTQHTRVLHTHTAHTGVAHRHTHTQHIKVMHMHACSWVVYVYRNRTYAQRITAYGT